MQKNCIICGSEEFCIKNVYLPVKDMKNNDDLTQRIFDLISKNELFYLRICRCCGKTELYNVAIVEEKFAKNNCKCPK
ncbi:hypothetical protein [Streptobacillus moniliformis]|uniref:hypothetical protein n=1 Tax=Streptobacillus moniliformis TaxID=34105 RepID=UPI0007E403BA|nr:hypothetical protein [Streptobacillus moniliformis]